MANLAQCDNCQAVTKIRDLDRIKNIEQRLDPGGVVPDGQCPECGALAYAQMNAMEKTDD